MRQKVTRLFKEFFTSETGGGMVLIACTVISMIVANSALGDGYINFWHKYVGFNLEWLHLKYSVEHWINDGLMAIFFLLIGLEIEREVYNGELSSFKDALLPIFAAIGGMVVPALFHFIFNNGLPTQTGIGIPMATDIAFALAVLSLLGNKVPVSLKIFLTALAIIDDLGAIIIIAIFYTKTFLLNYFLGAIAIFGFLLILNRAKVYRLVFYIVPGILMWYFMLQSGVHATITGVLLAFAIPFGSGDKGSPSYKLQHALHYPVALIILPIFALANTGIVFGGGWTEGLTHSNSLGILSGLFLGKPIGVILLCFVAIKIGITKLPDDISWIHILGAGLLSGIGFTMSIFITLLAFENQLDIVNSKIAVLVASVVAGLIGFLILKFAGLKKGMKEEEAVMEVEEEIDLT